MDAKSLNTLEYHKILDRLVGYASFSASAALVRALRPTDDYELAAERQARTTEARRLLSEHAQVDIGGARDVRPAAERAARGGILAAEELLDIRATLVSARGLRRFFSKLDLNLPLLQAVAVDLEPPAGLIEAIGKVFSEKGEIQDSASPRLAALRAEVKIANEKVTARLERMLNDPATAKILQEQLITMRGGRYVIPIRAELKSRMRCVVQDQSASGATLFVEPLAVVDLNNRWHEAVMDEKEEVQRILAELSALVGENKAAVQAIVRALASLDFALACAKYADGINAAEPVLKKFPEGLENALDPVFNFIHARHPLLDPGTVVPVGLALEKGTHALVITGPNTGGKTVTLKTAGLLALMAQSGLHIPAQSGSETAVFRDVFADIGDEQSIEQSLSTFSGHITNIVRILKQVNSNTLVLLDELGAGTDPQEGSALARAILMYLIRRSTPCLVATHYPELKAFAHTTDGVMNASVEFDLKSLKPTYRLMIGLPGRSNALDIAGRLGIEDEIIQDAREMINPQDLRADDLLDEIHRQLEKARREKAAADQLRGEADALKADLSERLEAIGEERLQVLQSAREEARAELETLRSQIERLRKDVEKPLSTLKAKKELRKQADEIEEELSVPLEREEWSARTPVPLRIGDRVFVRGLKTDGFISEIGEDEVEVRIGKMHVRADIFDIERSAAGAGEPDGEKRLDHSGAPQREIFHPSPGSELHLRGLRADDAALKLERYLEEAYAAGLPFVRIVHGKGTGALRNVARQVLSASPLVDRWENALGSEGGEGVTVAHIGGD